MAYMHIDNLYKNPDILLFRECYAMEKIHGTSANLAYGAKGLSLFAGGASMSEFAKLFDTALLEAVFEIIAPDRDMTVYGEAYGGKMQGMSGTYGDKLRFVVFEVQVGYCWLDVPKAESVALCLGLDFVPYRVVSTDIEVLNAEMHRPSEQAVKCGITEPKMREGIVLRPLIELTKNNGARVIAKHKNEEFAERAHQPKLSKKWTPEMQAEAESIADEWVTPMRMQHVIDKLATPHDIEQTGEVIAAMIEDVFREANGEIVASPEARKMISRKTALMYKTWLRETIHV